MKNKEQAEKLNQIANQKIAEGRQIKDQVYAHVCAQIKK